MKHALLVKENGESVIVTADGKEVGITDGGRRILHVLPKLFTPAHLISSIKLNEVSLVIETDLPFALVPEGGVKIRRPYPNTRYLVGGSKVMRNGWMVEIPDDLHAFDMTLIWNFKEAWKWWDADYLEVKHVIHVTLEPGDFKTYTMDASCWPRDSEWLREKEENGKHRSSAISLLGHDSDEDPRMKTLRDILVMSDLVFRDEEDPELEMYAGNYMEENLILPCIPLAQAWTIHAFEKEQIHEIKHEKAFTTNLELHKANCSVDLPPALLLESIRLAGTIPYNVKAPDDENVPGGLEQHPAIRLLTGWWEEHRKDEKQCAAGFFMPWVRVEDNDQYWCGDDNAPNMPMDIQESFVTSNARVGDSIMIQFLASYTHFTYEGGYLHIYAANGNQLAQVGIDKEDVDSGKHDEAWYTLRALECFPSRFPVAYESLKTSA